MEKELKGLDPKLNFVHKGEDVVKSLTVSAPKNEDERKVFLTLSDKVVKLRVKLDLIEIAGLADAVDTREDWKAFHTYEDNGTKTSTTIAYNNQFFNISRNDDKLAIKLDENECSSFALALRTLFARAL